MKRLSIAPGAIALIVSLSCVNAATAAPKVHWASGSGTIDYAGARNTHAFTAQIDADGNVKGEAEFQLRYRALAIHVEINCLAVVGNSAWLGGVIRSSSNPALVGEHVLFGVVDWGEGDAAPPDQTSQVVIDVTVPPCTTTPPLGLIAWTDGNVQVQ